MSWSSGFKPLGERRSLRWTDGYVAAGEPASVELLFGVGSVVDHLGVEVGAQCKFKNWWQRVVCVHVAFEQACDPVADDCRDHAGVSDVGAM